MEKKEVIKQINNLDAIYNLSDLITSFIRVIKDYLYFDEINIYYYNEKKLLIKGFLFKNNSIYKKNIDLSINKTLFEQSFVLGKSIVTDDMNYIDLFKKQSYISLGYFQVVSIPLEDSASRYGSLEFKQRNIVNVNLNDLKEIVYLFSLKFISLIKYEDYYKETSLYKSYLFKENIIPFYALNNIIYIDKIGEKFIKRIKTAVKKRAENTNFKLDNKSYYLFIEYRTNTYNGYIKDVSNLQVNMENKLNDIYYDKNNLVFEHIYLKNFLEQYKKEKKAFSIIKFKFHKNFTSEVLSIIRPYFDNIFYDSDGYIIISSEVDKRKINAVLKKINKKFNEILTLNLSIGIIRMNKDYYKFDNCLYVLEEVCSSNEIYYSKKLYEIFYSKVLKDYDNKKRVNSRNFDIYYQDVVDFNEDRFCYIVTSEFSNYQFEDNRFSLIILNEMLKRVITKIKSNGLVYYIELDSALLKDTDMLNFIEKRVSKYNVLKENIGFLVKNFSPNYDTFNFMNKALKLNYKICTYDVVNTLFKHDFSVSSMIIDIKFNDFNNHYIDLLKMINRDKYIDFIFTCNSSEAYKTYKHLNFGYALFPKKTKISE